MNKDYIIIDDSTYSALEHLKAIVFNDERINYPTKENILDNIITLEVWSDKLGCNTLQTFVLLHTTKDGKKIIANYNYYSYLTIGGDECHDYDEWVEDSLDD